MCGIFGIALKNPIPITHVFRILKKTETHKYPQEKTTLGGYGAGIANLMPDGSIYWEKTGKTSTSPVASLEQIVKPNLKKTSVLLAHVRMPSPEFMNTAQYKETAQPYVVEFEPDLTVVSVHNGKMTNYKEIRAELGKEHTFESEKYELIDSEVIPHYFEEIFSEKEEIEDTLKTFFNTIQGSNTLGILQVDEENTLLHLIHKGKTRGLTIWTNQQGEVIFGSRKEPITEELAKLLKKGNFTEKISIAFHKDANLKITFPIDWEVTA